MQIYKTLPTDSDFFKRYGKYASLLAWGIILAQILSGFTESGLIYSNVRDATLVFGDATAMTAGVLGAIVGVALIEIIGLRVALPGTVDAFLYKRWSALDLLFSIGLILLTLVLIPASFILSINGGGQIVQQLSDSTEQLQRQAIEADQFIKLDSLQGDYLDKMDTIKSNYDELIGVAKDQAAAETVVAQQNFQHWSSKGQRYKSRINAALIELQQVEVNLQARIAQLKDAEATELQTLQERNQQDRDKINTSAEELLAGITGKMATKSKAFQTGTKWIVIVAMFFSVFGIVLQRIFLKGSGIEEQAEPHNFYFAPSLLSEKMKLAQDRFQIKRRNTIAGKRAELPELVPYASSLPIHYRGELDRTILHLKMKESQQAQVIYLDQLQEEPTEEHLEQQIQELTQAQIQLEGDNQHTAARTMELKAKQVIRLYLERNSSATTDADISAFQTKIINHLNKPDQYENPFNEYRSTIGFKIGQSDLGDSTTHSPSYGDRREAKADGKICAHCNKNFQAKHWNAKYCGDACRIAAWEKRTGRTMKKKCKK